MTAVERGTQLLYVPAKDLPPLALEFRDRLAREVGLCIETCLTAFAVYAQEVEGLTCADPLYRSRPDDVAWFAERRGK